jgi:tetratricopeptide (TPR) repeat protein
LNFSHSIAQHCLIPGILLAALLSGCQSGTDLAALPVYDEGFQRTYFEAQNHLAKGDLDLAHSAFMACLDMQPEELALRFDLAKIDVKRGQYESAKLQLDALLEADENNRWAREYRADAALALGDLETVRDDLKWILQQRSGDIDWAFEWTLRLADSGDVEGAIALCDQYEELTPGDPDITLQRLYFLELLEDYEAIYHGLEQAVVDFPDIADFKVQWAQMLRATGQEDVALTTLMEVIADDPSNGLAHLDLAHLFTAQNKTREAQEALLVAFASEDVFEEEKHEILTQYLQISRIDPSLNSIIERLLSAALGQHPKSSELRMLAADFEQGRNQPAAAKTHALIAVESNPGNPICWSNLIALDAELGSIEDMESHALYGMDLFPLDANFAYYAAIAALDLHAHDRVAEALQRGLAVVLDQPELEALMSGLLGDALHTLEQPELAYDAYERSLSLAPKNPLVLNNYAYYLAEAGERLERALECSELLMELVPADPNFMDTHAWVLYKNGRYPEALDLITQALFESPNQGPAFWEHDGDIRQAMGDTDGAIQSWERAMESGGDATVLQQKIANEQ